MTNRLRQRGSISRESACYTTGDVTEATMPVARAPLKLGNYGRTGIILSEEEQENTGEFMFEQKNSFGWIISF